VFLCFVAKGKAMPRTCQTLPPRRLNRTRLGALTYFL
jgi:hypothetical protein